MNCEQAPTQLHRRDTVDQYLIDTHCHLDLCVNASASFDDIFQDAIAHNVEKLIVPGLNPEQWQTLKPLAQHQPDSLFFAIGLHPWWIDKLPSGKTSVTDDLRTFLMTDPPNLVAIGETGLDGLISTPIEQQVNHFIEHLKLADEMHYPIIIHNLRANEEMSKLLKLHPVQSGGVIHAFSGSYELGMSFWNKGFYLGIGGTITYPRAKKTRKAVAKLPIEALILETDAPDMPLKGYQGQANTPARLPQVAQVLAELKGLSVSEVAEITTQNAYNCFGKLA